MDEVEESTYERTIYPPFDVNKCTEKALLNSCKKALQLDSIRNVKLQKDTPSPGLFYDLELSTGSELAFAFKCPTEPPIYIQGYGIAKAHIIIHQNNLPSSSE